MNFSTNNVGHKDFSAHTKQESECKLTPVKETKTSAHYHAKAEDFTKNCTKPTLDANNSHKTFISESEIR